MTSPRPLIRAAGVVAAGLLAACGGGDKDYIYIGVAGPLNSANGESMRLSAEMAAREINDANGIGGRLVKLVMLDDSASPNRALTVAEELRRNPEVVAVIGHLNSAASLKAATVYNAPKGEQEGEPVVQISPASSSADLTQAGDWTFRVTPTDLEFSPVLASWAAQRLGRRRAAVLYVNDEYGQGVHESFARAFQRNGGSVVSADPFLAGTIKSGTELDPYLTRAMRRGADALVIGGQAEAGLRIIQAARRLGYTGPILGSDGLTGIKSGGPIAEGVFVSSAFLPDRPDTTAQRFVAAYRAQHGKLPDHRGAMTYDVMMLLRDAIRSSGTDRAAIRDYVAGVDEEHARRGVSGTIKFDKNGDVLGKEVAVGVVRNGQLVTAR
ncbi:MAG TPA: ABC transporter substrate-binding protein [Longimicrobium sp.]|uniref:ABC transporter substrate-binding protein n=1 Tax=Longimicrobium sp. TaxID=2029185 RepID=UPI002EDA7C1F